MSDGSGGAGNSGRCAKVYSLRSLTLVTCAFPPPIVVRVGSYCLCYSTLFKVDKLNLGEIQI